MMKRFFTLASVAAATMMLFSCAKETATKDSVQQGGYTYTFKVSNPETKSTLNDGVTAYKWEGGETLGIFLKSAPDKAYSGEITVDGSSAYVTVTLDAALTAADQVYGYYKYSESNTSSSSVVLSIPAEQDGSTIQNAMPMYTEALDVESGNEEVKGTLQMQNAGAVLAFRFYGSSHAGESVTSVTYAAEGVAGDFDAVDITGTTVALAGGTEDAVVSTVEGASVAEEKASAEDYVYMVVAPAAASVAGTITVATDKGTYSATLPSALSLEANDYLAIALNLDKFESESSYVTVEAPYENALTSTSSTDDFALEGDDADLWEYTNTYGAKITAYYTDEGSSSKTNHDADAWLVSPVIDLTSLSEAQLSFSWAGNYFTAANIATEATVWIREEGGEWVQLNATSFANNWTFVDNYIDINEYAGKKIQIGFHYIATSTKSGTLEIKNFRVGVKEPVITSVDPVSLSFSNDDGTKAKTVTVSTINAESITVSIDGSDFTISATDVEVSDNQASFTVKPNANAGDSKREATVTIKALYSDNTSEAVTIEVSQAASGSSEVTDILNATLIGDLGTTYSEWTGKTSSSSAVYAGQSTGSKYIQLRSKNSNSGIVTTTSGGTVSKVVVTFNSSSTSGKTINVYGKSTAYSAASDLYSSDTDTQGTKIGTIVCGESTTLEITDNYEYIGLRSNSGAVYIDSIEITWK